MELEKIAKLVSTVYGCNCDLDNWQPKPSTGHSCVCRIHKQTLAFKTAPKEKVEAWVIPHNTGKLKRPVINPTASIENVIIN
jgi:hypothetical protein